MNIAKIEWTPLTYDPNTLIGKINGVVTFEIRTYGVKVYTSTLLSIPFDNALFSRGINLKVLSTIKAYDFTSREKNIQYLKEQADEMFLEFLSMFEENLNTKT
jgi:hypothetical protein